MHYHDLLPKSNNHSTNCFFLLFWRFAGKGLTVLEIKRIPKKSEEILTMNSMHFGVINKKSCTLIQLFSTEFENFKIFVNKMLAIKNIYH